MTMPTTIFAPRILRITSGGTCSAMKMGSILVAT